MILAQYTHMIRIMKALQPFSLLIVALLLLGTAFVWDIQDHTPRNLAHFAHLIEDHLKTEAEELRVIMEDDDFVLSLLAPEYDDATWGAFQQLHDRSYDLFVTQGDSMIFWSSNQVQPQLHSAQAQESAVSVMLYQSRYLQLQRPIDINGTPHLVIGLVPIYRAYDLNNQHLENRFALDKHIPTHIKINDLGMGQPVRAPSGSLLFYLSADAAVTSDAAELLLTLLYGLGIIFISAFINRIAIHIGRSRKPIWGLLTLIGLILALRTVVNACLPYTLFAYHPWFSVPDQSVIIISGTLLQLIDSLLLLWLVTYLYREIRLPIPQPNGSELKSKLMAISYYSIPYAALLLLNESIYRLIKPTRTALDLDNIFEFSLHTFLGISIISVLALVMLLLTHKILIRLHSEPFKNSNKTLIAGLFIGVVFILNLLGITPFLHLLLSLFLIAYLALYESYISDQRASYQWIGGFLFTHAFIVTTLIAYHNFQNERLERLAFAQLLSAERDITFERNFEHIQSRLSTELNAAHLKNPLIPRNTNEAAIQDIHAATKHIKQHYDVEIAFFDRDGQGLRGEKRAYESLAQLYQQSDSTLNPYLRFYSGSSSHSYIARISLSDSPKQVNTYIFLQYHPKGVQNISTYPALLIDRSLARMPGLQYQYAEYMGGQLVRAEGKSYASELAFDVPETPKKFLIQLDDRRSHLVYRSSPERVIVVSKQKYPTFQFVSLFSYIFLFMGLTAILMAFLSKFHHLMPRQFIWSLTPRPSLHNSIQISILLIIIITFVTIGAVTFYYFTKDSEEYHKGRLDRKTTGVISSAQYWIQENSHDSAYQIDIAALASIHRVDINLFDTTGQLIKSSQPLVFDKGLLAAHMNPLALRRMQQNKLSEEVVSEQIGKLQFRTAYLNVRNAQGRTLAYIGMPYYSERSDLNEDIADFTGVLLNIFVLLLIVAFIAAYVTAQSITHPLAVLKNKLQRLKLGQKNEPLQWARKDEIGVLIDEYNRTLTELEASAKRLAESEREGAWREMAKQVAHEIKNPLTPMKLSMQYLVRAYQSRPEAIGPMLERVSKTMIEQIDGLARIATEFSNFAKMPKAENEVINLNALVASAFDLFSENDDLDMALQLPIQDYDVFADKEQLIRVFNNIIKNAIQAIPEERKGEITITLDADAPSGMLRMAVKDNGTGIPADKQDQVFVPHFTTKNSGTGLGLAICKKIVEQAQGSIYFKTQAGIGTTFFIELPIHYQPQD